MRWLRPPLFAKNLPPHLQLSSNPSYWFSCCRLLGVTCIPAWLSAASPGRNPDPRAPSIPRCSRSEPPTFPTTHEKHHLLVSGGMSNDAGPRPRIVLSSKLCHWVFTIRSHGTNRLPHIQMNKSLGATKTLPRALLAVSGHHHLNLGPVMKGCCSLLCVTESQARGGLTG